MNKQGRGKARAAGEANPALKAVLIYENVAAGVRARGFLQKLAYASNRTLEEQMWNFDALGIREVRNTAASAACKADVVAVSVSAKLKLPGTVRAWLDIWLWLLEEENPALAEKLYTVTQKGTTVIIADDRSSPRETVHPGLLFPGSTGEPNSPTLTTGNYLWRPDLAPTGPVTIIISASNGEAFVYRNGVEIGHASVTVPETEHIGIQVFTALDKIDADGHREWLAVTAIGDGSKVSVPDLARRSSIPEGFLQKAREVVIAGTTLILSDLPVSPDTQSKPGFNILTASRGA